MKIKALRPVEVGGHICRKGETIDHPFDVTPRIAANFTAADGAKLVIGAPTARSDTPPAPDAAPAAPAPDAAPAPEDIIARTVRTLKRDGIMRRLDGMNITYSPRSKDEYLAKLLLSATGELEI